MCECGYTTTDAGNWSKHKKVCKLMKSDKDTKIASLEQQLVAKDQQMKEQLEKKDQELAARDEKMREQLSAKDEIINQLIESANTEFQCHPQCDGRCASCSQDMDKWHTAMGVASK